MATIISYPGLEAPTNPDAPLLTGILVEGDFYRIVITAPEFTGNSPLSSGGVGSYRLYSWDSSTGSWQFERSFGVSGSVVVGDSAAWSQMGFARDDGEGPWAITAVNEAGFESAYSNQVERPVVFPYSPDTHDLSGATGGSWDTADLDSWGPWDIDTNEMLPDGHPDYGTLPTLQLYLFMPGGLASDSLYAMTRSGKPFNLLPPVNGVQPMFCLLYTSDAADE